MWCQNTILIVRPKAGQNLELDIDSLEKRLAHVLRNWQDDLREALVASHGESEGLRIASRIGKALPAGYIEDSSAEIAATAGFELTHVYAPP